MTKPWEEEWTNYQSGTANNGVAAKASHRVELHDRIRTALTKAGVPLK